MIFLTDYTWHSDLSRIEFTETVQAKKVFMKSFVKGHLKKQQERYVDDLKEALKC